MKTINGAILLSIIIFLFNPVNNNVFAETATTKGSFTYRDTIPKNAGVPLQPEDISPLLPGENIPAAVLPDTDGRLTNLKDIIAQKPTILVFYRGGWCPYCTKQLSGLLEIETDLRQMGYQVIAISTDSPENLRQTATKQKLNYLLLSDADLTLSKQFGIAFKSPKNYDKFLPETSGGKNTSKLLPVPSVFIVNTKGNIRFEYINPNFSERMSPALLKAAALALVEEGL